MARKGNGKGSKNTETTDEGADFDDSMTVEHELSEEEIAERKNLVLKKLNERDTLDLKHLTASTTYRSKRKALVKELKELRESIDLGVAKVPAQASLPGTK